MRQILVSIIIFLIFFFLGASLRAIWFFTFQKRYLEYLWFEKPLAKMQGGADSPQEAWEKYLSALERGDIEEAMRYWWSEASEDSKAKNYLYSNKDKELLKKEADCDKNLIFVEDVDLSKKYNEHYIKYAPPEKKFKTKCRVYKEVNLSKAGDEASRLFFEEFWNAQKSNVVEGWVDVVFKYNFKVKKWFINELDYNRVYFPGR
jgi:hypothetical protein